MNRVSISLDRNDWGQIVDGLEARRASWEVTVRYLEGDEVDQAIEQCRDAEEVQSVNRVVVECITPRCASRPAERIAGWAWPR